MNRLFLAFFLLLASPVFAADKDAEYLALVDAAIKDPATAKWCEIRDMYPSTSFYRALGNPLVSTKVPEMGKRMLMEKSEASVSAFMRFSRENFGSLNAHRYAAYLYKWHMELALQGMEKVLPDFGDGIGYIDFKLETKAARELLKCMAASGDGKGFTTAYHAVTFEEERLLIEQYFHVDVENGAIKKEGGKVYSIVNVQIPGGTKTDIYFRLDDQLIEGIKDAAAKEKEKAAQP